MSSAAAIAPPVTRRMARHPAQISSPSAVLCGVFGLLFFGPLAFGAVQPWSIFILEAGSALLFAIWAIRQPVTGKLEISAGAAFFPMLAFAILIILQIAFQRTAYRAVTVSSGRLFCAYGLLFFLVTQGWQRNWQIKIAAAAFSVYGFVIAAFAIIQDITSHGKLYWIKVPRFGGWIYGPYVNHNHYAGLMEMLVPIPLVLFLSPRARSQHKIMAAFAAATMASTIFLCGSRGGMLAFAAEMAALAGCFLHRRNRGKSGWSFAAFIVMALALILWLGGHELLSRISSMAVDTRTELSGGTRLGIDRDCLRMFVQRPLTGWGLGVFSEIYPQFRSFPTNLAIEHAHNDYLQLLVETGVPGFAVMIWFLVVVYRSALRKVRFWPMDLNSEAALAALLGITGILVHSFLDFNLQIPANAALFFVLCAVASLDSRCRSHRSIPDGRLLRRPPKAGMH
jgi:O-antigen ligase